MHSNSLVALALVAPYVAFAAPAPQTRPHTVILDGPSFKVPRVRNENHVRNGKAAMQKAFRKFNWPIVIGATGANGAGAGASGGDADGLASIFGGLLAGGDAGGAGGASGATGAGGRHHHHHKGQGSGTGSGGFNSTGSGAGSASPTGFGGGDGSGAGTASPTGLGGGDGSSAGSASPTSLGDGAGSGLSSAAAPLSTAAPSSVPTASAPSDASSASSVAPATSASGAAGAKSGVTGETAANAAQGGAEYLSPVIVGGQTLNLDFDTGSADLWVYGTSINTQSAKFDTSKSATFKATSGSTFMIKYGDGSSASGTVGTDTVSIGQATVAAQAVEVATKVSGSFLQDSENDGLLGLAFSSINSVQPRQVKTFFDSIKPQLAQPLFTVSLAGNASGGEYEFGTIDDSKHTGDIVYTPVNNQRGFWQFTSTAFKVGDTVSQNTNASPTIADTGTSLMLVDDALLTAYYGQVSGAKLDDTQGGYVYPCSAKLPDFSVAIGDTGKYATIPGDQITFQDMGTTCFGGIQSNQGQGLQIFGDAFLKSQFVVFDGGNTQIGFAPVA